MIVFDNVKYQYHYEQFPIFDGLSFTLHNGVNTILCDVQGGKTTICKILCNLIEPQSGKVTMQNFDLCQKDNGVLHLPQKPTFFFNKSVGYNIAYPLKVRKIPKQQRKDLATQLANKFDLPLDAKVKTLNHVDCKKLALARGLSVARKVVLFDDFFDDILQIKQTLPLFEGAICVILTSNPNLAQGHVVVLDGGKCAFEGHCQTAVNLAQKTFF